jgi:hypothetical protein
VAEAQPQAQPQAQPGPEPEGMAYLRRAAQGGSVEAATRLGMICERGYYGQRVDARQAEAWFRRALALAAAQGGHRDRGATAAGGGSLPVAGAGPAGGSPGAAGLAPMAAAELAAAAVAAAGCNSDMLRAVEEARAALVSGRLRR